MPIFHKHRLIFTHLPKTGGRAINAWLGGIDGFDGHVSLNHVNNIINIKNSGYRKFTIIRDPVDRVRSAWNHHKRHKTFLIKKYPSVFNHDFNNGLLSPDFEKIIQEPRNMIGVHFFPIDWLFNIDGERVHHPGCVLDFDNLEKHSALLVDRLGLKVKAPFIFSQSRYHRDQLSPTAQYKFNELYKKEIELFDFFKTSCLIK